MYQKIFGFAVISVIGFAACHNVFNKDKSVVADSLITDQSKKTPADSTSVITSVSVTPQQPKDSNLKYIYLTFDDGPQNGTLNCYDVCKKTGVKATFFLVGEHAENRWGKGILETMRKDMRHFLFANHSYSHAHNRYESFYKHYQTAFEDFTRTQDSLQFQVAIARFPGNPAWVMDNKFRSSKLTNKLAKMMDSVGYNVMGWDVEWRFNKKAEPIQTAEQMANEVEWAFKRKNSFVKNHVVLLTHDRMFIQPQFRDSLTKVITILQAKKYVFETADQYPILKKADKNLLAVRH